MSQKSKRYILSDLLLTAMLTTYDSQMKELKEITQ